MKRIKKGDEIQVISGTHKGHRGVVSLVKGDRVSISSLKGVKLLKADSKNPEGGKKEFYIPVHVSNISHFNVEKNRCEKIFYALNDQGVKERKFRKTGVVVGFGDK